MPCRPRAQYLADEGIEEASLKPLCGGYATAFVEHEAGRFVHAADGEESFVVGVRDDRLGPSGMVAWPLADPRVLSVNKPDIFPVMGAWRLEQPGSFAFGPLPIFRSALDWLKARGFGLVILDYERAVPVLRRATGSLLCEDAEQFQLLDEIMNRKFTQLVLGKQGADG